MRYMVLDADPRQPGSQLHISGCLFAGYPTGLGDGAHITRRSTGVEIRDVTIFPGKLTHKAAILWGLCGMLRLGEQRIARIRQSLRTCRRRTKQPRGSDG